MKHRIFSELCKDLEANELKLLHHAEIRWLSREKVLKRVFQLRNELSAFLTQEKHTLVANFEDIIWLATSFYLTVVFKSTNQLNLSMQGKVCCIFKVSNKVQVFKSHLKQWQSNANKIQSFTF